MLAWDFLVGAPTAGDKDRPLGDTSVLEADAGRKSTGAWTTPGTLLEALDGEPEGRVCGGANPPSGPGTAWRCSRLDGVGEPVSAPMRHGLDRAFPFWSSRASEKLTHHAKPDQDVSSERRISSQQINHAAGQSTQQVNPRSRSFSTNRDRFTSMAARYSTLAVLHPGGAGNRPQ
jgi:hypothetical protein